MGLHPSWLSLCPGDWVMWVMPNFVRVGQVDYVQGRSIVIRFQGDAESTVLPDGYMYWLNHPEEQGVAPIYSMFHTDPPAHGVDPVKGPEMTVRQAAAILGKKPKHIRQMLRSGTLRGRREDGSWVAVLADSVNEHRVVVSPVMVW